MGNEWVFVEPDLHDSLPSDFVRSRKGEGYGLRLRRRMGAGGVLDRSLGLGVRGSRRGAWLGREIYPRGVLREGRRRRGDQVGELRVKLQLLLVRLRLSLHPLLLLPQSDLLLLLVLLFPSNSRSV